MKRREQWRNNLKEKLFWQNVLYHNLNYNCSSFQLSIKLIKDWFGFLAIHLFSSLNVVLDSVYLKFLILAHQDSQCVDYCFGHKKKIKLCFIVFTSVAILVSDAKKKWNEQMPRSFLSDSDHDNCQVEQIQIWLTEKRYSREI